MEKFGRRGAEMTKAERLMWEKDVTVTQRKRSVCVSLGPIRGQERAELDEAWKVLLGDSKKGCIDLTQLIKAADVVLGKDAYKPSQCRQAMNLIDINGDGYISQNEFMTFMTFNMSASKDANAALNASMALSAKGRRAPQSTEDMIMVGNMRLTDLIMAYRRRIMMERQIAKLAENLGKDEPVEEEEEGVEEKSGGVTSIKSFFKNFFGANTSAMKGLEVPPPPQLPSAPSPSPASPVGPLGNGSSGMPTRAQRQARSSARVFGSEPPAIQPREHRHSPVHDGFDASLPGSRNPRATPPLHLMHFSNDGPLHSTHYSSNGQSKASALFSVADLYQAMPGGDTVAQLAASFGGGGPMGPGNAATQHIKQPQSSGRRDEPLRHSDPAPGSVPSPAIQSVLALSTADDREQGSGGTCLSPTGQLVSPTGMDGDMTSPTAPRARREGPSNLGGRRGRRGSVVSTSAPLDCVSHQGA